MQQQIVRRALGAMVVGVLALAAVGCKSNEPPRPFFPTAQRPAATSIIGEGGDLIIRNINGTRVPGRNRFMSQLASDTSRYEVPAGPCSLDVQHADGKPKTVRFDARAGTEYQLDSYLKPRLLPLPVQPDQWDVMVKEKPGGTVVVETRDARR